MVHTDSTTTAWKTDCVVRDVPRCHNAAFGSLRDGAGCDLCLRVSASVLVDDHSAVQDGFRSDSVGLEGLSATMKQE